MAAAVPFDTRSDLSEGERLGERIAELNTYLNVAEAEFLDLLRVFDEQRHWEELGFKSCAHWLNFKCGIGFNAARERIRMAHALVELPKIRAGFAEGSLSFSKVRAMTRVATEENEDLLLNIAHHGTAYHVERFVSQYRRVEKLQEPGYSQAMHERRDLTYRYDEDGCLVIKARIPAEQGEVIVKALERAVDARDTDVTAETSNASDERDSIGARSADAMCAVAETYLNSPENAGSTADRYQVVVHVRSEENRTSSRIENGPYVSAETSERIACDCCVTTIEEDAHGEPLNIGRRSRTIPAPIRRALIARDGGCRFPGCTTPHRFCHGHHVEHWQHGGETCLDNLILLCGHHHRLVHEGGFDCRKSDGGEIYFVDQRQRRIAEYERSRPVSIEQTLAWMHRRFDTLRLDRNACVAQWNAGEEMDLDHAMIVAFQRPCRSRIPPCN